MAQEPDDLSAEPAHDSFLRRLALPVAPAEPTLRLGTKVKDRYVVTRPIGSGGMGEVYLARDVSLERDVALKRHRHGRDVERLRREALAMARLAHPNVVTVYEVGELEAGTFVAMEYVPGTTLRGYLAESARSFRQIEEMLRMAGLGLAAAHDAGIVHRDFKPENVLVGRDGRARVSDFGLASQRDDELEYASTIRPGALGEAGAATALGSAATVPGTGVAAPLPLPLELTTTAVAPAAGSPRAPLGLTAPGTVMGTPAYMAPEQASGEVVDARADQYAFCVVAWEALFGERPDARAAGSPEQGGAKERIGARAGERAGERVGERVAPGAPLGSARRWRRVLARGLSVRPADRFADMHALLEEARARRPWAALAGAVGLLAAASAATWWLLATPPLRCEDAGAELDDAGPLARWRALELDDAVSGVDREVLRLRRDYRSAAQTVCRARVQGAWSKELAARGQGCLALQRQLAAGLLGEASPSSPGGVDQAAELALRALPLPAPLSCADPTRLWALPALPQESAAARTAVRARVAVLIAERSKQPIDEAQLPAAIRGHAYVASRLGLLRAAGVAAGGGRAGPLPAGAASRRFASRRFAAPAGRRARGGAVR
ncbi:MAG: serine/threonine protein kinase [Myxococcales bacterium]|nr:serine/threonine protein kinase [Myxococcales bacterium]